MKILLYNSKKFVYTFIIANLFFVSSVFGQAVGDYRSNVNTTGNWTNLTSWHRWDGSSWIQPTVGQGYPGQIAGTYAVLIQAGNTITILNTGILTQPFGTLTIDGSLVLTGNSSSGGIDYFFNTQTLIVTPLLGTITMSLKVNLKLPVNASLQVISSNSPVYKGIIVDTSCTHNQKIYIGSSAYAYCQGTGTEITFADLMAQGGYNIVRATSSSPVCGSVSTLTAIATPSSGATINWYTVSIDGNSIASGITYTPTISTTTTYYVEASFSGYTTPRIAVVAIANPLPTTPTRGTITQPTCALSTGSVVLSDLPASGTLNQTKGTVVTSSQITGKTMTITGLDSGTYTYTVSNGSCTSGSSSNVVIDATINTWNVVLGVGSWTNTLTNTQAITFNGDYNSRGDLTACSCQVNAGVYVDINSGHTLTLTNKLVVSDTGNILFKDKSSLVQINNVINTGKIGYERKVSNTILVTDYTYWSSPVASFTLGGVYPNNSTGLFYSYGVIVGVEDWKSESSGTIMTAGKGYIINGKKPYSAPSPPPAPPTFIGVPNNGDIPVTISSTGNSLGTSNLLGNPYPSAINADSFLSANSTIIEGTIYFWTHYTEIQDRNLIGIDPTTNLPKAGSGAYAYTSDDYASYNTTGGVAGSDGKIPLGKIAAGQGFFATSKALGTVTFTNAMRRDISGNPYNNSQFYKTKNPNKSYRPIEKNRIWLNLTNTQGAFKQTLIGYLTDATNDYDDRFDGESFDGNEFVDFYSVNQDKNLVIQGRALPFDDADEVPLGFRTTINGVFTINIDQVDGFLANQAVFLEDKLTNTVFNLKTGNYTFSTTAGTFDDRFVLKYLDTSKTLTAATFDSLEKTVLVSNKNKQIKIDSAVELINKVTVFDLLGRQIYQKANVNSNELSISNIVSNRQVVIVKTVLQNGKAVTRKIIY